jgi:hypothetical protein
MPELGVLTIREAYRLKVFENRVIMRTFGPERDKIIGWGKLYMEELHNLYASSNTTGIIKSRRIRLAGYVALMLEKRNAYRISVGKPERKRLLERPRRRWEYDIKIDLRETGQGSVDWIDLTDGKGQWKALVMKVMKLQVP